MNRIYFFLLLFLPVTSLKAQSVFSKISKISRPEKCWAIRHPFVTIKALKTTQQSWKITDSLKQSGTIGTDNSGGRLDAFKHAFWIASVSTAIGIRKAIKLGKAHEKGNKLQFKKHQLEDRILPDSVSSYMDLYNNEKGAELVEKNKKVTLSQLQQQVLELLNTGQLLCILKDNKGNYLTCEKEMIDMSQWYGKWNVPKCPVKSNESEN